MIESSVQLVLSLVDQISAPLRATASGVTKVTDMMTTAIKGAVVAAVSYVFADFFKGAVDEAMKAEDALNRLRIAVGNAGQSFAGWEPQIDSVINRLTKLTKYGDDDLRAALTNMVSKTGDVKGSLGNMGLAADLAAKNHITLAEAGDLVGKAMNGNTKVFKEFGITTGTTAQKMQQLRDSTAGYASGELNTLSGRLAQAKQNFDEVKESVGRMILGTGDAEGVAGKLSRALADLAAWLDKNQGAVRDFQDGLSVGVDALMKFVGAAYDLGKTIAELIDSIVPFKDIWAGVQIALVAVTGTFQFFGAAVKFAAGGILLALGSILDLGAPILNLFSDKIGAAADKMLANGMRMVEEAKKTMGEVSDATNDKILMIAAGVEKAEKRKTDAVAGGINDRKRLMTKEQEDAAKAAAKEQKAMDDAVAKAQEIAHKATMVLMGAHFREMDELRQQFNKLSENQDEDHWAKIQLALDVAQQAMIDSWIKLGPNLDTAVRESQVGIRRSLADTTVAIDNQREPISRTALEWDLFKTQASKTGDAISKGAEGVLTFTDALGKGSPQITEVVGGIEKLGGAIGKIGSGDVLGGLTGAIGALQGILGGIFGTSPAELARRALMQQNVDAMKALHADYGRLLLQNDTGAQIGGLQELAQNGAALGLTLNEQRDDKVSSTKVAKWLATQGLTLADLNKVAGDSGVDLSLKNGQYSTSALLSFIVGLKDVKIGGFDTGIQGQLDQRAFQNQLGGGSGLTLQDYADVLGGPGGSPFLAQIFQGDPAGLSARIQAAGLNINNLTPGSLGNVSASQARTILTDLASLAGGSTVAPPGVDTSGGSLGSLPSTSTVVADVGGFGLRDLADLLGGKLDRSNELLATIATATSDTADAVRGGGLAATVDEQLFTSSANSNLNSGVTA